MEEAVFKALDAGVALLRGPNEPLVIHLLRDVLKHVAVLQAAPQVELDAVLPPDPQQGASLLVRPGHLPAHFGQEVAGWRLLVCAEEQQTYYWVVNLRNLLDISTTTTAYNYINTLKPTHVRIIAHERLHGGVCSTNVHIRVHRIVTEHRSQKVEVSVRRGPPSASGKCKSKACWEMCLLRVESFNICKFITQPCYSPPVVAVTPVSLLQSFDPVVALLRRPQVSNGGHLLRYLSEYVAVADAGFQAVLHVVCRPHLNESHRLQLRPCCVHALCTYFRWMNTL